MTNILCLEGSACFHVSLFRMLLCPMETTQRDCMRVAVGMDSFRRSDGWALIAQLENALLLTGSETFSKRNLTWRSCFNSCVSTIKRRLTRLVPRFQRILALVVRCIRFQIRVPIDSLRKKFSAFHTRRCFLAGEPRSSFSSSEELETS